MISTVLDGVDIFDGTIFVINDTATLLPGNTYPDGKQSICEDPISQDFPSKGDPQYQDVVAWQSTDPVDMLETDLGAGAGTLFTGSVGEFTSACGSSRGRVKGGSHYFIGLHVDFGPGFEWGVPGASNTAGNFDKFVELTRYKLTLLAQSVEVANDDDALVKNRNYKKMRNLVKSAIRNLDAGNYVKARSQIDKFLLFIESFSYDITSEKNHLGDHLMRASNIEFMLRVKVIQYSPEALP